MFNLKERAKEEHLNDTYAHELVGSMLRELNKELVSGSYIREKIGQLETYIEILEKSGG